MNTMQCLSIVAFLIVAARDSADAEAAKSEVTGQGFVADFYSVDNSPKKLGILVLGGAEGGKPDHLARVLAKEGYPVLSLAYFRATGTPDHLDMIPLEYLARAMRWLKNQKRVKRGGIALVGGSKGAELALLLASRESDIRGVIAFAPSSVVFQGIPKVFWPPRSSWSFKDEPIPFVPYDYSKGFDPNDLLTLYKASLKQAEAVKKATIEVEKINGPLLLFSGSDDKMWPSAQMGDMICKRLREKKFKHKYEHFKYADAGHTLNDYFMLGGTPEGNRKARIDSAKRMLDFINTLGSGDRRPAGP